MELPYEDFGLEFENEMRMMLRGKIPTDEIRDKECVVCGLIRNEWDHYQYPCGHYGHSRCVRKWATTIHKVQCPWCRENMPDKKYCDECDEWGHITFDELKCPAYKETMNLMYNYPMEPIYEPPKRHNSKKNVLSAALQAEIDAIQYKKAVDQVREFIDNNIEKSEDSFITFKNTWDLYKRSDMYNKSMKMGEFKSLLMESLGVDCPIKRRLKGHEVHSPLIGFKFVGDISP